jgi:hypothetical protein
MKISELQKIRDERTDNYSVDPDSWEKVQEYIYQHTGVFYKTYESWKNHVKSELLEYIDKVLRYKPIEDDTKLGGKVLSALGIPKDFMFYGKPANLLKDTSPDYVKLISVEANAYCPMCSHFGLPAYHSIREWVRVYPAKDGSSMHNGECKLFVDARNELRVDGNYDGQVSGFFERLCIDVMKMKYSNLKHPTQRDVLDRHFNKDNEPCYICDGHDLVWEKEHFYMRAAGFSFYWIDSDGNIQFNILKSCEGCNRGTNGKGSQSPQEYFGENYNSYCDMYNMPKEPKVTANGNNWVMVQDMIEYKEYCFDYINQRSDGNKEKYLKMFENFIS